MYITFFSGCMLEEFKFSTVDKNNEATTNGKGLLIVESKSESGVNFDKIIEKIIN